MVDFGDFGQTEHLCARSGATRAQVSLCYMPCSAFSPSKHPVPALHASSWNWHPAVIGMAWQGAFPYGETQDMSL